MTIKFYLLTDKSRPVLVTVKDQRNTIARTPAHEMIAVLHAKKSLLANSKERNRIDFILTTGEWMMMRKSYAYMISIVAQATQLSELCSNFNELIVSYSTLSELRVSRGIETKEYDLGHITRDYTLPFQARERLQLLPPKTLRPHVVVAWDTYYRRLGVVSEPISKGLEFL